ncbi:MAG: cation:proton antiporter [Thermoleophilia bacterium]|nr:cation:proton antiporter [Thermoleophilia bacterium]
MEFYVATAAIALITMFGNLVANRFPVPVPVWLLAGGLLVGDVGFGFVATSGIAQLIDLMLPVAVAIIVFEGSALLGVRVLREVGSAVRNIVALDVIVNIAVGSLVAHYLLDFRWSVAAMFGALLSVTGPSVIGPLLRTVPLRSRLRGVLEAESIIIDPIGAIVTLLLLDFALIDRFDAFHTTYRVLAPFGIGVAAGLLGAVLVIAALRRLKVSRDEASLVTAGMVVATFSLSEVAATESGLVAMVVMGIIVGNVPLPHRESQHEFYRVLVGFLLGFVYVLLAARVNPDALAELWPVGILVYLAFALIARPIIIGLGTIGSSLTWRERAYAMLVAPRGVVAAGLAAVVAVTVSEQFGSDGEKFVAAVFLVIALSISIQMPLARWLSAKLGVMQGSAVVIGGGRVGMAVANRLEQRGLTVVIVDVEQARLEQARAAGYRAIAGDGRDQEVLERAGISKADAVYAVSGDDATNLLITSLVAEMGDIPVFTRVRDSANTRAFRRIGGHAVNPAESVADSLLDATDRDMARRERLAAEQRRRERERTT